MSTTAPRWLLALALIGGPALAGDALPQKELNYGYASLYAAAKGLRHSDKMLLLKRETPAFEEAIQALSATMDAIARDLEALAREDPRVKLDDEGMPEIERRKRDAVTRARVLSMKPVTGRTGADFERTMLLSESGALNQLKHLALELDKADPDARRSEVLQDIHRRIDERYDDIVALLNRKYFK